MAQDQEITAEVVAAEHAGTSVNGNPSWWLTVVRGGVKAQLRTMSDGAVGYEVSNWPLPARMVLTLTPAGRVRGARSARPEAGDRVQLPSEAWGSYGRYGTVVLVDGDQALVSPDQADAGTEFTRRFGIDGLTVTSRTRGA